MDNVFIKKEELNKWVAKYFESQDLISVEDLISVIEDLDTELEDWKSKYEDLENDLEDNYKPISKADQYDIHDGDFI